MTYVKRRKGLRMSCDVGEVTERLENGLSYDYNYELCSFYNLSVAYICLMLGFSKFIVASLLLYQIKVEFHKS